MVPSITSLFQNFSTHINNQSKIIFVILDYFKIQFLKSTKEVRLVTFYSAQIYFRNVNFTMNYSPSVLTVFHRDDLNF